MIFGKVISSLLCYFVVIVGFIYVCLYVKYINFFFLVITYLWTFMLLIYVVVVIVVTSNNFIFPRFEKLHLFM